MPLPLHELPPFKAVEDDEDDVLDGTPASMRALERDGGAERGGSEDGVVYLSSASPSGGPGGSTVLVRILRRTVEQERLRTEDALNLAIKLKKDNLALKRELEEARARADLLQHQLDRARKSTKRASFEARIDQLAARLVGDEST